MGSSASGGESIFYNIIGGLIVAIITLNIIPWLRKRFYKKKFKQIFGENIQNYNLVYSSYLSPAGTKYPAPPPIVPRKISATVNIESVNSTSQTRCVNYLSNLIVKNSGSPTSIKSHQELDQLMDISFISIGGVNNFKSIDVINNPSNIFVRLRTEEIICKKSGGIIAKCVSGVSDCGFILKINPDNNPLQTWICIAGLGEWGTSGAAWWFAKYWEKEIQKKVGKLPFACITETKFYSDTSTKLVRLYKYPGNIVNY